MFSDDGVLDFTRTQKCRTVLGYDKDMVLCIRPARDVNETHPIFDRGVVTPHPSRLYPVLSNTAPRKLLTGTRTSAKLLRGTKDANEQNRLVNETVEEVKIANNLNHNRSKAGVVGRCWSCGAFDCVCGVSRPRSKAAIRRKATTSSSQPSTAAMTTTEIVHYDVDEELKDPLLCAACTRFPQKKCSICGCHICAEVSAPNSHDDLYTLICDCCGYFFHCRCVGLPDVIPKSDWFCSDRCRATGKVPEQSCERHRMVTIPLIADDLVPGKGGSADASILPLPAPPKLESSFGSVGDTPVLPLPLPDRRSVRDKDDDAKRHKRKRKKEKDMRDKRKRHKTDKEKKKSEQETKRRESKKDKEKDKEKGKDIKGAIKYHTTTEQPLDKDKEQEKAGEKRGSKTSGKTPLFHFAKRKDSTTPAKLERQGSKRHKLNNIIFAPTTPSSKNSIVVATDDESTTSSSDAPLGKPRQLRGSTRRRKADNASPPEAPPKRNGKVQQSKIDSKKSACATPHPPTAATPVTTCKYCSKAVVNNKWIRVPPVERSEGAHRTPSKHAVESEVHSDSDLDNINNDLTTTSTSPHTPSLSKRTSQHHHGGKHDPSGHNAVTTTNYTASVGDIADSPGDTTKGSRRITRQTASDKKSKQIRHLLVRELTTTHDKSLMNSVYRKYFEKAVVQAVVYAKTTETDECWDFKECVHIGLFADSKLVSCTSLRLHGEFGFVEVVLFATDKTHLQQGNGRILNSILRYIGQQSNHNDVFVRAAAHLDSFWLKEDIGYAQCNLEAPHPLNPYHSQYCLALEETEGLHSRVEHTEENPILEAVRKLRQRIHIQVELPSVLPTALWEFLQTEPPLGFEETTKKDYKALESLKVKTVLVPTTSARWTNEPSPPQSATSKTNNKDGSSGAKHTNKSKNDSDTESDPSNSSGTDSDTEQMPSNAHSEPSCSSTDEHLATSSRHGSTAQPSDNLHPPHPIITSITTPILTPTLMTDGDRESTTGLSSPSPSPTRGKACMPSTPPTSHLDLGSIYLGPSGDGITANIPNPLATPPRSLLNEFDTLQGLPQPHPLTGSPVVSTVSMLPPPSELPIPTSTNPAENWESLLNAEVLCAGLTPSADMEVEKAAAVEHALPVVPPVGPVCAVTEKGLDW